MLMFKDRITFEIAKPKKPSRKNQKVKGLMNSTSQM